MDKELITDRIIELKRIVKRLLDKGLINKAEWTMKTLHLNEQLLVRVTDVCETSRMKGSRKESTPRTGYFH